MFINTSKILFESKSQPVCYCKVIMRGCLSIRQRYFLKANHNIATREQFRSTDVYQYVKDTFWKQITTWKIVFNSKLQMFINTSKILFESKSQLGCNLFCCERTMFINTSKILFESKSQLVSVVTMWSEWCLSIRQRYFLKANHNRFSITTA